MSSMNVCRLIRVYGIVQGVGFRPFVARIAAEEGIAGSVCNKGPFVEIYARGAEDKVNEFLRRLTADAPERSAILKVEVKEQGEGDRKDGGRLPEGGFHIIESERTEAVCQAEGDVFVSPDIATCDKCRAELFDKNDRRYLHPFINCTACGPRLTILDSMPYDRERTSMKDFPMCKKCNYEYTTPSTRRYHAQPVCCNDCGPRLIIIHPEGRRDLGDAEAITKVREVIRNGGIAAVKGIGGFHLCCDATDEAAVRRLRRLKARKTKPFAVMMKDIDTVRRECQIGEAQEAILTGHNKPIMLLQKKDTDGGRLGAEESVKGSGAQSLPRGGELCPSIAPNNPRVGVMLPYAPVQMLLFDYPDGKPFTDCLVMTSGNPRGAPICRTDEDALETLSSMSDIILSNNRTIRLRADDSVMAWDGEKNTPVMIRRSRGYAPLPVMLEAGASPSKTLAIGGELKNTFCLSSGGLFYLSPYIGDMADVRSVDALKAAVERMERLLEITPNRIVCDKHPLYNTATVALEMAKERGLPLFEVQHHHAHVASCMAENGWTADKGKVIGVAFDGTGYGDDGTIWGGEVLVADYKEYTRAASIEPFFQAGGDLSSRQGWRIASALLDGETVRSLGIASSEELSSVKFMLDNKVNTVMSTSCGRIFDAVSAILGFCRESSFEGEAAMRLQAEAEAWQSLVPSRLVREIASRATQAGRNRNDDGLCRSCNDDTQPSTLNTLPRLLPTTRLVKEIAERSLQEEDKGKLAYYFHDALSAMVLSACEYCRGFFDINAVALTGGVFNNTLLRSLCRKRLEAAGFDVLLHTLIPAGDGGIALGQAAIDTTLHFEVKYSHV